MHDHEKMMSLPMASIRSSDARITRSELYPFCKISPIARIPHDYIPKRLVYLCCALGCASSLPSSGEPSHDHGGNALCPSVKYCILSVETWHHRHRHPAECCAFSFSCHVAASQISFTAVAMTCNATSQTHSHRSLKSRQTAQRSAVSPGTISPSSYCHYAGDYRVYMSRGRPEYSPSTVLLRQKGDILRKSR